MLKILQASSRVLAEGRVLFCRFQPHSRSCSGSFYLRSPPWALSGASQAVLIRELWKAGKSGLAEERQKAWKLNLKDLKKSGALGGAEESVQGFCSSFFPIYFIIIILIVIIFFFWGGIISLVTCLSI